jgi:hypothetical protein
MTADTVGNPLIPRSAADACPGCLFVLGAVLPSGSTVTDWTFYGLTAGYQITPFLIYMNSATITGIGATRTGAIGVQDFGFGLTAGSAVADANTMFGWIDSTMGTIAYDQTPGAVPMNLVYNPEVFAVGAILTGPTTGYNRYYSIQVTTSTMPEPCTWFLFAASGLSLATLRRLRRCHPRASSTSSLP